MKVIIITSNDYLIFCPGMFFLMEKNWDGIKDEDVILLCYDVPTGVPDWIQVESLGTQPPSKAWSTKSLIRYFSDLSEPFFLVLEDCWLMHKIDTKSVDILYSEVEKTAAKADLSDFISTRNHTQYESYEDIILLDQSENYRNCLQPSIWSPDYFRKFLVEGQTAWEFETKGMEKAKNDGEIVIGMRHEVFAHGNFCLRGKFHHLFLPHIDQELIYEMAERGMIPDKEDV